MAPRLHCGMVPAQRDVSPEHSDLLPTQLDSVFSIVISVGSLESYTSSAIDARIDPAPPSRLSAEVIMLATIEPGHVPVPHIDLDKYQTISDKLQKSQQVPTDPANSCLCGNPR